MGIDGEEINKFLLKCFRSFFFSSDVWQTIFKLRILFIMKEAANCQIIEIRAMMSLNLSSLRTKLLNQS